MDFRSRFPLRLGRPGIDEEVDAELEFHLEMRVRELMSGGMTQSQARRAALERFGDFPRARRECRAIGHQREHKMRVAQYLSELRQDATFAIRQMFATPAFTVVAVAILAVGIGATTAIFSAMHAVVLRPLPVPAPDRLVAIVEGWRDNESRVSISVFRDIAAERQAFESVAAVNPASFTLAQQAGAERVIGAQVTGGFFDVFGVPPAFGRVFGAAEDSPGRTQVVVLSHRLWTRLFGGDTAIVGRDIRVNQQPHTVLGVMPASFDFTADASELWVPSGFTAEQLARRDEHFLTVYARLQKGISLPQAAQRLDAVMERRAQTFPTETAERWLAPRPFMQEFVGEYRQRLLVLFGAVFCVLLIACGNVSNLLLARGAARAQELAVRSALGAGQARLARQLLTENLLLGVISAAAGIAIARGLLAMLIAFSPREVPRLEQAAIAAPALIFAVVLAVACSVIFGLVPAWRASREDVTSTLKEAGRGAAGRGPRDIVRSTLIAGEVALALVLLVGAGLLIRSAIGLQRVAPGFDPRGVFSGRILLPEAKYAQPAALLRASRDVQEGVARIPGVRSAALASAIPGFRSFSNGLLPEGAPLELRYVTQSDGITVTDGYFSTMGMTIREGRGFEPSDRVGAPLVVILNETAARSMWPGDSAIGKRLTSAHPAGPTTVIGVVADARLGGPSEPAPPTFYVPIAQLDERGWSWIRNAFFIVARTDGNPALLASPIRRVVSSIDSGIPLYNTLTMEERMASTLDAARFNTMLLALLGCVGLLLAGVGIYGVISYFASRRTTEIGIRLALGASRTDVVVMVVRQVVVPVSAGIVSGIAGAVVAARALSTQLVGIETTDPVTLACVAGLMAAVGVLAAVIPARRAAAMDPARALQAT